MPVRNCDPSIFNTKQIRQRLANMESKNKVDRKSAVSELHRWGSLPSIGSGGHLSHRTKSRIRRQCSRIKELSSQSLFDRTSFGSDTALHHTFLPAPQRRSLSCHDGATNSSLNPAPSIIEKGSTVVVYPNLSPPSMLNTYKEKAQASWGGGNLS